MLTKFLHGFRDWPTEKQDKLIKQVDFNKVTEAYMKKQSRKWNIQVMDLPIIYEAEEYY